MQIASHVACLESLHLHSWITGQKPIPEPQAKLEELWQCGQIRTVTIPWPGMELLARGELSALIEFRAGTGGIELYRSVRPIPVLLEPWNSPGGKLQLQLKNHGETDLHTKPNQQITNSRLLSYSLSSTWGWILDDPI